MEEGKLVLSVAVLDILQESALDSIIAYEYDFIERGQEADQRRGETKKKSRIRDLILVMRATMEVDGRVESPKELKKIMDGEKRERVLKTRAR